MLPSVSDDTALNHSVSTHARSHGHCHGADRTPLDEQWEDRPFPKKTVWSFRTWLVYVPYHVSLPLSHRSLHVPHVLSCTTWTVMLVFSICHALEPLAASWPDVVHTVAEIKRTYTCKATCGKTECPGSRLATNVDCRPSSFLSSCT